MYKTKIYQYIGIVYMTLFLTACAIPTLVSKKGGTTAPASYKDSQDSTNTANINWKEYFSDPNLIALIDTALKNNQELNITLQEIQIANNEIAARRGDYLPFVSVGGTASVLKVSRYTSIGASDASTQISPGRNTPEVLPNFMVGAFLNWEVDIWRKLRNAKKSAYLRYLASVEGKNFLVTRLIADIANNYYELLALDNELEIIKQNIEIQTNALKIVKQQKEAARVTELAVRRFEAQVLNTQGLQYNIQQQIIEAENRINFLLGRYPQPIPRDSQGFSTLLPKTISLGIPSQLLANRPDIRQAQKQLEAAKVDIKVAKANFYPSLKLSAGAGLEAFNPAFLIKIPESLVASLAGGLVGPIINRYAIKTAYYNANSRQIQTIYNYERTILTAYLEVVNQLSNISNLENSYNLKKQQVEALTKSVSISNDLFKSARADYMEVLLTQRDALEARFDLIEIKMRQLHAAVNIYRALGGGWK